MRPRFCETLTPSRSSEWLYLRCKQQPLHCNIVLHRSRLYRAVSESLPLTLVADARIMLCTESLGNGRTHSTTYRGTSAPCTFHSSMSRHKLIRTIKIVRNECDLHRRPTQGVQETRHDSKELISSRCGGLAISTVCLAKPISYSAHTFNKTSALLRSYVTKCPNYA